jgi:hypothetical protein
MNLTRFAKVIKIKIKIKECDETCEECDGRTSS